MEIAANIIVAPSGRSTIHPPAEVSLTLPAAAPDELAVARFAAVMKAPEITQAAPPEAAVAPGQEGTRVGTAQSLGDKMLASLQGASDEFKNVWRTAENRLQSDQTLEMREMMAMQLQVTQMAVQYELLGKVVSRSTQNFDQLARVQ